MPKNHQHSIRNAISRRDFVGGSLFTIGAAAAWPYLDRGRNYLLGSAQTGGDGQVAATANGTTLRIANEHIAASWRADADGLRIAGIMRPSSSAAIGGNAPAFWLSFDGRANIASIQMKLVGEPKLESLAANPQASQFASRLAGRQIVAEFRSADESLGVTWRAILREGAHYVRQQVTFRALKDDLHIDEACLIDLPLENANVVGTVRGSPIVSGDWFCGFEHPLSGSTVGGGRARCTIERQLPLKHGQEVTYSSVIGVAAAGQMRRDFLRYIERERAHPYRTFLHYNTWYDFEPFTEAQVVDAIDAFGQELYKKRGVTLDSFLLDDGWDDHKFWGFNSGFPHGFEAIKQATAKYDSKPGVWLSPWGGYAKARQERLAYAKEENFETNREGLALSGPVYYKRFREVCLDMVRNFGVNQFKFDGTGSSSQVIAGSQFGSDFEAAIALIEDLRAAEQDIYINLTTGTYPSPFWLQYADSTWRGGDDHSFAGVGSWRQQWITYRDGDTFRNVVNRGPLYPLNSLMLHGIIFAQRAHHLETDPNGDFASEVRSYFGTGTQCQEMYITHSLLNDFNWNVLAQSAKWSRANAETLVDTHWIGGDPNLLEVYGWAAWSEKNAVLTLRNPSDKPQSIKLEGQKVFEFPKEDSGSLTMLPTFYPEEGKPTFFVRDQTTEIKLAPFEVLPLQMVYLVE